jgi:hypothetical protein
MICQSLANLFRRDSNLVREVVAACQQSAEALQRPDPRRLTDLKAEHERLTRAISCTLRNPGESEADLAETDKCIREFRAERAVVARQMEALEAAQVRNIQVPTEADVRADIEQLQSMLIDAANGATGDAEQAREIIKLLTGGRIELFQQGERLPQRGWLQGRFTVRLLDVLGERAAGAPIEAGQAIDVVIDFKRPDPEEFEQDSDRAWEFDQQDMLRTEIAAKLGCKKSKITKLLKYAAAKRGVPYEDGRRRRQRLSRKSSEPANFELIADDVYQMLMEDRLIVDIAEHFGVSNNHITKVIEFLRKTRGQEIPDGRTRRKSLEKKNRAPRRTPMPSPSDESRPEC